MDYVIDEAVLYVRRLFANDSSGHDCYHTLRVYRTALKLAETENADRRIVSLAALLHDADDRKLSPDTCENKDNAVRFMREHDVPEDTIASVVRAISEVSFSGSDSVVPTTIEGKCVQDADRLDALGAIGIARAFAYGGKCGRRMYDPDEPPLMGMDGETYQTHVSTSVNHFYEKLFLLKDMMNTDAGRAAAQKREAYMREYIAEFMKEWDGEDMDGTEKE